MSKLRFTRRRSLRSAVVVSCLAAVAAASAFAAGAGPDKIATSRSGPCGTLPFIAPKGASTLNLLPKGYAARYAGFTDYPIVKSAWANWKPKKKSGFNIQIVWVPKTNPLTNAALAGLQSALKASGKVKTIQVQAVNQPTDVPLQLQQYQTAVSRKPDLIVAFPLIGSALAPLVNKAGAAGIPTVTASTGVPGKYAVGVNTNVYQSNGWEAASVLKQIGGKGNVLIVHGLKGVPNDVAASNAYAKVLSRCPNVKIAGEVEGFFLNSTAKQVTQQFLATHPSGVSAVLTIGTMGTGVVQAFGQTGHDVAPIADNAATQGEIAYWHGHPKFKGSMGLTPQAEYGTVPAQVVLRMLAGNGVKINTLLDNAYVISTLKQANAAFKPSYKESDVAGVAPPAGSYFTKSYLNGFFNK